MFIAQLCFTSKLTWIVMIDALYTHSSLLLNGVLRTMTTLVVLFSYDFFQYNTNLNRFNNFFWQCSQ